MRSRVISSHLFPILLLSLLALLTACGQGQSTTGSTSTPAPTATSVPALDAYGTPIAFPTKAPQRIISMVPSISEILGALNLQQRVVAVDSFTDYPAALAALPKISSNGKYSIEQIIGLKPDLVLSYGGDTRQYDTQLKSQGLNVVDLPSANLTQILQQIRLVGRLTFTQDAANGLASQLQQQIDQVKTAVAGTTAPKAMIEADDSTQNKPYVFGGGSFGDELLRDAQAQNVFGSNTGGGGFPQVSLEAVISANPQYIILTEDPAYGGNVAAVYKRANWGNIAALKQNHVYRINSSLLGRPGPRLVEGLRCIAQIIHPDKFSGALPAYCTASV
ncbi:MAG: ABC transporter substrate-binding protein [Ktedonobacteraceae bacterium]|nr:ABC transporter substrate-binding protein [Chloroflexota bacterium]